MNTTITRNGEQILISLSGRLDTTNVQDFEKQIVELYDPAVLNIEMDCSDFTYISSSGLRILLTLQKSMIARKGTLVLL
ncbi:MAG: STAS domain-containing protein, partial [Odoribacter sp.]